MKASSTCRPAPVMPAPGDSAGSSRQPPETRVECSLEKCPSICMHLADLARLHHALELAHRGKAALVVAGAERDAGRLAPRRPRARLPRGSAPAASRTRPACRRPPPCAPARHAANAAWPAEWPALRGSAMASFRSVDNRKPCLAASSRASSGSLVTPCTMRRRSLLPWIEPRTVWPQRPRPTIAALIIVAPPLPMRLANVGQSR